MLVSKTKQVSHVELIQLRIHFLVPGVKLEVKWESRLPPQNG